MRSAVAAAVGLALVPLSHAWNVELPPCLDDFKPFVSSGCFQDGSDPTLIFRSGLDQHNMTVEKCVADCKGNGFRYAGLEYYGVCFCGSTVNGPQVPDSQCSLPCSGNKSETCGGDKALSVWQDPTFPKSPEDVTVDDYKSLGCFTDDSTKGRTLSWPVKVDGSSFTTKKCLAACEKGGFPFAGTEYGGECWCGVVLANDTAKVHESECNMPCRGDASDKCGGRARLSLFVAKDLESLEPCGHRPVTTSSSQAVVTTTTKPYYEFPNTTTPVVTMPVETTSTVNEPSNTSSQSGEITSSKPVETITSTPPHTSSAPQETSTSNAPGKPTTTSQGTASTPSQGTTVSTKPQETPSSSPGESGTSTKPEQSSSSAGQTPSSSKTTTGPVESSTTRPGETTVSEPQESSSTKPGETPSSTPNGSSSTTYGSTTNKPSESTDSSAPGETSTPTSWSKPGESSSQSTKPAETPSTASSSSAGEPTTPSVPSVTTSSSNAGQPTSSTQSGGSTAPTSSNAGETTAPTTPPSSTPNSSATSTTASLCTATSTVPSRCEWQRGNWCAPPLPDWNSRHGCQVAAKTCALQVVSCFKYAGWPHTIDCFDFQRWCRNVQRYCVSSCRGRSRCDKSDCWSKYKPGFGKPPAMTTSVFPCPPASATNKPTTTTTKPVTSCPPVPTNICKQPSNDRWGYSPSKPVGGIPLPVVGCNDMRDDWRSRPYKLYTEPDTNESPSFRWPERPNVCAESCKVQYTQCRDTYVDSCRRLGWKGGFHKRREGETDAEFARRAEPWSGTWADESEAADASSSNANYGYCAPSGSDYSWARHGSDSVNCWGWGGNTPDKAEERCRAQYSDCLAVNAMVNPGDQCKTWCRNY